jgi:hypothetical protein
VTAGQHLVTVANVNGCALCGLTEDRHPVQGFGHMDDTVRKVVTTKAFVRPSANLIGRASASVSRTATRSPRSTR